MYSISLEFFRLKIVLYCATVVLLLQSFHFQCVPRRIGRAAPRDGHGTLVAMCPSSVALFAMFPVVLAPVLLHFDALRNYNSALTRRESAMQEMVFTWH